MSERDISVEAATGIEVAVPSEFTQFVDATVLRLGYLFPELSFSRNGDRISVDKVAPKDVCRLRRDVLHTLYREKIYAETLPMRQALFEAVLR